MRRTCFTLLILLFAACAVAWLGSCGGSAPARKPRLLIVGFDGMDPKLVGRMMAEGRLPHFRRVAEAGSYSPLATSVPPQSPVAWSHVISGVGNGAHQIFDFIHRDPNPPAEGLPLRPFLSTSQVEAPSHDRAIDLGRWQLPLSGGKNVLLRQGPTFWQPLVEHGVDTAIYRIPANYPALHAHGPGRFQCMSGMGTPDLIGTYGEFTVFTPDAPLLPRRVGGGQFVHLELWPHRGSASLTGPDNHLLRPDKRGRKERLTVEFKVVRDPQADVASIRIGDHLVLLEPGEWSKWLPIDFETGVPGSALLGMVGTAVSQPAMVRFYLRSVHPKLELYATPLNIDPLRAVTPISAPDDLSARIARDVGRYYTTGIPEDTKALRNGALDEDEYLQQVDLVLEERIAQYRHALSEFETGCLFFYFGTPDLLSHIFWRDRDPDHPGRDPEQGDRYAHVIEDCYVRMDALVGEALEKLRDQDTIIILSDHGFTSFRRAVHLNTWLLENGYLALLPGAAPSKEPSFRNVDWSRTRAYALGINSLFVNLREREKNGIVAPGGPHADLLAEMTEKLLNLRDEDGSRAIAEVYSLERDYPDADATLAPDLIIGYADHYRSSWSTALGGIARTVIEDNLDRWSGDHCVAARLVPGILVTNRKVVVEDPKLSDLAATILGVFGIEPPEGMGGRDLLAESAG